MQNDLLFEILKLLFAQGWGYTGIAVMLLIYFLMHPEKLSIWGANVSATLSFLGMRWERRAVSGKIEGYLNLSARELNSELPEMAVEKVKVKWIRGDETVVLDEGECILKLEYHHNESRNLAMAALTYASGAVAPHTRLYLKPPMSKALDFVLAKKMLRKSSRDQAVDYLVNDVLDLASKDPMIQYVVYLEDVDQAGFLTRILLREYVRVTSSLYPRQATATQLRETEEFLEFLRSIAIRKREEEVPLKFGGQLINLRVVLVALAGRVFAKGLSPYVKQIQESCEAGIPTYVCARGMNAGLAKEATRTAVKQGYAEKISESEFEQKLPDGTRLKAVCILLRPRR